VRVTDKGRGQKTEPVSPEEGGDGKATEVLGGGRKKQGGVVFE